MAFQVVVFQVLGFFFFFLVMGLSSGGGSTMNCNFPAIFNFGDSNSDTGGKSAAFTAVPPPNGETFFGKPSGRCCDGRLIIDFIAEELGFPYLGAYLDSLGSSSFAHGANFATAGSSIRKGGYSPFHLEVQISQFQQFKARIEDFHSTQPQPSPPPQGQGQPFLLKFVPGLEYTKHVASIPDISAPSRNKPTNLGCNGLFTQFIEHEQSKDTA